VFDRRDALKLRAWFLSRGVQKINTTFPGFVTEIFFDASNSGFFTKIPPAIGAFNGTGGAFS